MPEVSSRNIMHERLMQIKAFVVAVYCIVYPEVRGTHAIRTYLRQEPLSYFFYASPF
jgi:hypothetical protein